LKVIDSELSTYIVCWKCCNA